MLLADVNVYLYAHRRESDRHDAYRAWLEARLRGPEPFGVSEQVLSAFVRIATHHRIYADPTSPEDALAFCDTVWASPAAMILRAGERHWAIFVALCRAVRARANVVPDAYLAALAIEHGATWVTLDSGFRRFPGLRVRRPLED